MTKALGKTIMIPWLLILIAVVQIVVWGVERQSPFYMKTYAATAAAPGGTVFIVANVDRSLGRKCNVEFNRHLFDSRGYRYDISGSQFMSWDALNKMDAIDPNKLLLTVLIPPGASPGQAQLVTVLHYECNQLHKLFPIHQTLTMKFEVL